MVGLVGDHFLGPLAVRDVARHAVGAEELALPDVLVGDVHADRIERDRHQGVVEGALDAAARVALEAQLDVARSPLVHPALVEHVAGPLLVLVVHQDRVMLADQFIARKAQQLLGAVVDEGELALVVQGVDDVGRTVDQVAVHLLRVFQLGGDARIVLRQRALLQRVLHRLEQLLAAVRLAQVIVGAPLQGADGGLDAHVAAHHDHVAVYALGVDVVHDLVAAHVGQAQVEQHQVELELVELGQRLAAAGGRHQVVVAVAQQFVQRRQQARFVIHQQQARPVVAGQGHGHLGGGRVGIDGSGGAVWGQVHHGLKRNPSPASSRRRLGWCCHGLAAEFQKRCPCCRSGR